MFLTIILILGLLGFFGLSSAIVYHLYRFSPEKKNALLLIGIYIAVSVVLVAFVVLAFREVDVF